MGILIGNSWKSAGCIREMGWDKKEGGRGGVVGSGRGERVNSYYYRHLNRDLLYLKTKASQIPIP